MDHSHCQRLEDTGHGGRGRAQEPEAKSTSCVGRIQTLGPTRSLFSESLQVLSSNMLSAGNVNY